MEKRKKLGFFCCCVANPSNVYFLYINIYVDNFIPIMSFLHDGKKNKYSSKT